MITVPIIVVWFTAGAVSAFGGWLFHRVVKLHNTVSSLEDNVRKLEQK